MDEYAEIILLDEDDIIDVDDFRNARRDHRSGGRRRSRRRGPRSGRAIIRSRGSRVPVRTTSSDDGGNGEGKGNAGSIIREDTGGLSTGKLVESGAQVLAAIQPLPLAPVATGKVEDDVANLVTYQQALAEHAKRDEQLRTIGSLASKLFA